VVGAPQQAVLLVAAHVRARVPLVLPALQAGALEAGQVLGAQVGALGGVGVGRRGLGPLGGGGGGGKEQEK